MSHSHSRDPSCAKSALRRPPFSAMVRGSVRPRCRSSLWCYILRGGCRSRFVIPRKQERGFLHFIAGDGFINLISIE